MSFTKDSDIYTKKLPSPYTDYVNRRIGRLVGLSAAGHDAHRNLLIIVRCDCGVEKIIRYTQFDKGETKSCGCLRNESRGKRGQMETQVERMFLQLYGPQPTRRLR